MNILTLPEFADNAGCSVSQDLNGGADLHLFV